MKKAYFFIDDVIWVLRDLTRQKPASMFDHPFLGMLKTAYERYGIKTQLNLFYRTDYAYGMDEFTLAEMTDCYKAEWEAASDWLKLAFHAKQEFPDYPLVNATYEDVKAQFTMIKEEVLRFAGENSFVHKGVGPHWASVSKAGVKAFYDCGVRIMEASHSDDVCEYNGDPFSLPYGHAFRLLQNRQPETKVFQRGGRDVAINNSICGYNHLFHSEPASLAKDLSVYYDRETGMGFKLYGSITLNLVPFEEIESDLAPLLENEYIGIVEHEEYFFEDYCAYQPDYADKVFKMGEILKDNGYEFIFIDELVK